MSDTHICIARRDFTDAPWAEIWTAPPNVRLVLLGDHGGPSRRPSCDWGAGQSPGEWAAVVLTVGVIAVGADEDGAAYGQKPVLSPRMSSAPPGLQSADQ